MRLLVTGGAGFIGSHVVAELVQAGHQVTVVDDLSTGRAEWVAPPARLLVGDVVNPGGWDAAVGSVDAVIHLAAQVSVAAAEREPSRDARVNVEGTLAVLEWAARRGVREVRLASSAAVYGHPSQLPVPEDARLEPISFYGLHKLAAEWAVRHWASRHAMAAVVLRLANVYGPRQRAQGEGGVVAVFARALAAGEPPVIHGDGEQTRDFVYVQDVARVFAWQLGAVAGEHVFNVGTGQACSVNALWQRMAELFGGPVPTPRYGPPRPGDIRHSRLDPTRLGRWGIGATTPLATGLRATIDHFRDQATD
ncbi:MAG: NAD-dependent epimerase/dehydratase family protein [Firmicutes bacterium]|nr:NAD-dependent epimerase/dehydratase family protein [Alicyclobacillaceae bacterium]MCL6497133.1 NAD-dependent epimerase/dehydratase family protein [Bacillota bacterium]